MNKRLTKNIPQTMGGVLALIAFREISVNYGYEEGMKRILAKQIQQISLNEKAYVKRKCKARRETEFFRKNSVSVAPCLNMS